MRTTSAHQFTANLANWLSRTTPAVGALAVDGLGAALATAIGNTRQENQDCAVAIQYFGNPPETSFIAYILCDGIGGLKEGGLCARVAVASVVADLVRSVGQPSAERLVNACEAANAEIYKRFRENGGTTLCCILKDCTQNAVATNVGDSRIYRVASEKCVQISTDDNIANQVKSLPNVDLPANPGIFGRQLTQFIGMGPELRVRLIDLQEGSSCRGYLLTSDGIHNMNPDTFNEITVCAPNPVDTVKRLSAIARWGKATDNGSAIFLAFPIVPIAETAYFAERLAVFDSFSRLDAMVIEEQVTHREAPDVRDRDRRKSKYFKKRPNRPKRPGDEEPAARDKGTVPPAPLLIPEHQTSVQKDVAIALPGAETPIPPKSSKQILTGESRGNEILEEGKSTILPTLPQNQDSERKADTEAERKPTEATDAKAAAASKEKQATWPARKQETLTLEIIEGADAKSSH